MGHAIDIYVYYFLNFFFRRVFKVIPVSDANVIDKDVHMKTFFNCGLENLSSFFGQSQVVDPDGNLIHRASRDGEEIGLVEIDPSRARDKAINSINDLFADRRTDLYELN